MKIIIDAMGGDNAPDEIVKGTIIAAKRHPEAEIVLVGRADEIRQSAEKQGLSLEGITVEHAESVVTMEDNPADAFRNKKDSSLCTGLRMLKEDGDVFLSAGSTGALIFCSTFTVRRLPGVDRPCLAAVLPFDPPVMIVDCGANIEVKPEYFAQWALLGSIYYKNIIGNASPRVGLLNNGAEETKGTELQIQSYDILKGMDNVNFVGNVEGRYVPLNSCEVLLCDGFTGNVLLKYTEGVSKMFMGYLKDTLYKSAVTKAAALLLRKDLNGLKERFNYKNYGGAPVIGLAKPVFKAHGNSDAAAFASAVEQAVNFVARGAEEDLKAASEYLKRVKDERKKENV